MLFIVGLLAGVGGVASAAPTTDSFSIPLTSATVDLGGFHVGGSPGGIDVGFDVTAQAQWISIVSTGVNYEPNDVRQGALLNVTRQATAPVGIVNVQWTVAGISTPGSAAACFPQFAGGDYTCTATSGSVNVVHTPGIPLSPYVEVRIVAQFSITPEGIITPRSFSIGNEAAVPDLELETTGSPATDSLRVPCDKAPGDSVAYSLNPFRWTPATVATQRAHLRVGVMDPVLGIVKVDPFFDEPFGPTATASFDFDFTGDGHTTDMGQLLPNNVTPTVDPFPLFAGNEGSPIAFSATVHSQCPIGWYLWDFSDGTVSYGPKPERAFGDDGLLNGQLTVTDVTNLSGAGSFEVRVANVLPSPFAGPNTSGAWGIPIAFAGQAVDPGWLDQPFLVYSWNWGDGTPGTGGAVAQHVYRFPGDYTGTLTVCDDHSPCPTSTTSVHVRKRTSVLAFTGGFAGIYSAQTILAASVVDEFGNPVPAAPVMFTLNGATIAVAQTDPAGNAQAKIDVLLDAGVYPVTAGYSGGALYDGSAASGAMVVSRMASSVAYTGALNGGPNKTVTLSAKLVDALGRPLAGKSVVFQLGTQHVSATTDAGGVASTPLKLSQKNGKYALTATWVPVGSDASKWIGSTVATSFSLQAK